MSYDVGNRTVGFQLSSEIAEYVFKAISLGAITGPLGEMDINPQIKPLLDAMNHILAGGAAKVEVTKQGDPNTFKLLSDYLKDGIKEGNEINKAAGYYVTAVG